MDEYLRVMYEFLAQWWDALFLPFIAFVLIVVWGVRQRSVVRHFREQFRSQSDESDKLHILNSFALSVLGLILVILFFGVLAAIGKLGVSFLSPSERDDESLRWLGLAFFGLVAALGAILGAPLAIIRVNTTERQTRAEEEGNRIKNEEANIRKREYTTSLLNQSTEHLGASLAGTDPVKPSIPVRIGGLLTLERIAQDNIKDYHVQIMDIICAYIRENSPHSKSDMDEEPPTEPQPEIPPSAQVDIQYAIDVLARRTPEQIHTEKQREGYHHNLDQTNLTGVDFVHRNRVSDFSNASFVNCSLIKANFGGTNLEGAVLRGAILARAMLMEANLSRADLERAILVRAILRGANLTGANLSEADLTDANFSKANLSGVRTNLSGANLSGAYFAKANLSCALLSAARVNLSEATLPRLNLSEANLSKSVLIGAKLLGADFSGADLRGARLKHAHLEDTDFSGADLSGAILEGAILEGADFSGADLSGADLSKAVVTKVKFDDAKMEDIKPNKSVILDYTQKYGNLPTHEDSD